MTQRPRVARLILVALAGLLATLGILTLGRTILAPDRTAPLYDPPVLAGQWIPGYCSAGVYARLGDAIVLTTSPHCGGDGIRATSPDGTVQGVLGPTAVITDCPHPDHTCKASDMSYLVVESDRVPWGHLNEIDLGAGGYRIVAPDTKPLVLRRHRDRRPDRDERPWRLPDRDGCREGRVPPPGRPGWRLLPVPGRLAPPGRHRRLRERGAGAWDPGGVTTRSLDGNLGFTPLAEGLSLLGLEMCTTPDCGLVPPGTAVPGS